MTLKDMKIGLLPYSDGSGYRFEVSMDEDGKVYIRQAGHLIEVADRNECSALKDALDALWSSRHSVSKLLG